MGYSPGFLPKIGRFRTLANSNGIFTNKPKNSQKCICKHAGDVSKSLGRILKVTKIRPSSKPWAIAQAFCSKSVDFGHLRILTESLPTCSKIVGNPLSSMMATFQRVWDDFSNLPKSALFKTMGYSPGFLLKIGRFRTLANSHGIFTNKRKNSQKSICKHAGDVSESLERFLKLTKIRPLQNHGLQPRLFAQNRSISDPCEFSRNLQEKAQKQLEIHLQACRRRFRKFGTISRTYQNPPSSKQWAIAQAFCSKSVDFGPLRILTESLGTSPKTVRNPFASMQATFQRVWDDFSHLPKSALFKTMGYSPGFLLKIGRFRTLANSHGIFRNKPKNSQKSICKHGRRRFREFGTISRTYQNPPSSKPWAIAQAFCSKSVDFGHLRILTESLGTSPKTVRNPFASMQATFQRVWDDFSKLPKSALFKTMGYSPGFLLKIGRFRTLANSHGIFTNKPKNSQKSIFKHAGDVSESLGRFLALTKIRPLQNHGLQPRLFAQNRSISDTCEFSRNLYQHAQKQLEIHFQACRRRFREFGTISRTYQNPPSSKPWAIAQAFCSKSVDFGHLRILTESLPTCPKIVGNPLSSMQGRFREFGTISRTYQNPPSSKPWAIAQAFCSKWVDFGPLRILTESLGTRPKNSQKSICKHAGDVSESLGRFLALTKIRRLQNHGLQPRLFAQNRSISDTCEFSRNLYKQAQKQLEIHLQACRRRFREFGTISRTYQNPPSSKPWAIAQAFCSKSVDFGHLRILTESLQTSPKNSQKSIFKHAGDVSESLGRFLKLTKIRPLQNHGLQPRLFAQNRSISDTCEFSRNLYQHVQKQFEINFQACRRRFREFGTISRTYQNPPSSKPWAIAQAFCSKWVDFGHLRILTESLPTRLKNSEKSPFKHAGDVSESLGRFLKLTKIRPLQNHGLQPRLFAQNRSNFGHLRILTDSLQTSPKTVRNPFASMQATFQKVWDDFQNLPKSALFKTMGYSPGFLLKIGQFRTLANSHGIFTKKPKNSHKSICKHAGEVSESLGRFLKLTKIRPLQNHGLQPRLFAQNGSISDTCEFSRNLYQHPQKQLEINFQACRRSFREFGTISQTYQNPPSSKPWAIAQAICSKWVDFGHLRILTESLPTSSKIVGNPLSSMEATFQRVWDDFSKLPKSALFKTMGYSPGFLLKIGRFRTLANSHGIFTNKPKNSQKSICKHAGDVSESLGRFLELTKIRPLQNHGLQPRLFAQNRSISDPCEFSRNLYKRAQKQLEIHLQACRRRFREFGTISRTYQNPPSSKPWAIAQAFCSKWVDFGHLRILTESLPTCSKIVRNPLSSMMATFQRVWDDFSHLPKSALFKTMGYSPGFLLKIGRFRTLANSHGIFTNMFKSSWKSTFKHAGDV